MRTEAEIRREVEKRLRRRGLLLLDGGLGALAVFFVYQYDLHYSLGNTWGTLIMLFLLSWFAIGILHTAYVLYVEAREYLVHRAIERERQFYVLQDTYEKRKRDAASLRLSEDGELVDFPLMDEEVRYERRS